MMKTKEISAQKHLIMLIEDSPQDREATIRAFKKSGLFSPVVQCEDGDEALDYLQRRGKYSEPETSPRPSLILLDLNLPGKDGFEILSLIRSDAEFKKIPVIVLTTSSDQHDINRCYEAGANSYVQKPVDLAKFERAIELIKSYWFEAVLLPGNSKRTTPYEEIR